MRHPFIVEIAWAVLIQLAEEMQRWRHRYVTEGDVQAELYRRLASAFEVCGVDTYPARWNDPKHGSHVSHFSRIGFEHSARLPDGTLMRPDLLIYDDLPDEYDWPADPYQWPVLLAIELKFQNTTSPSHADLAKLASLISSGRARFGCWINVRNRNIGELGLTWHSHTSDFSGLGPGQLFTAEINVASED